MMMHMYQKVWEACLFSLLHMIILFMVYIMILEIQDDIH